MIETIELYFKLLCECRGIQIMSGSGLSRQTRYTKVLPGLPQKQPSMVA